MLTSFQTRTVAYVPQDAGVVECAECFHIRLEGGDLTEGATPLSRYEAEKSFPEGLSDAEGHEIVEPAEDYCRAHDGWREHPYQEPLPDYCENAETIGGEPTGQDCDFPGDDEVDPNPPKVRWVPCSVCGARDGERCDLAKHRLGVRIVIGEH